MSLPDSGFDYVAAVYDPLARLVYGRALQQAQLAALTALPTGAPYILIIGGGTGWVLGEALRQRPAAKVLYLEASPQMLRRSQEFLRQHWPTKLAQVEFRLGTEDALRPREQFDAVVTFFLLDLFEPARLRQLIARLQAARRPEAPWLLADFARPATWWHRSLLAAMYAFFGLTTGISARRRPPIELELQRLGLAARPVGSYFGGMVEASVWQ
ncbi:class I SAM-dependent methyltransferase [Hymenobacter taeanensis]|uniref:Class I SAM-dependent methyltransferase n=1 Tax=Hymenobacter taeanensis TaxID=2735321 RepID=A0A6M6BIJ9_9BACT|nr:MULTISPECIES: class I SAM-dependent methyltransferase [Hymenobacter]QJX47708.1 class I SAM-dependent methyltransferase [Hymenobacter taeanensis]UOQ82807.1 class I SAM-dependent methyltransferase [Hymenobacter sp. 5414T-23]